MLLAFLAFLGGVLTILSPCVLPVLPFVFARSEQPFARSTLPLLLGMSATFAGIATLAAVGGNWAVRLNDYGRCAALVVLAGLGVALLSRRAADFIARPFVAFGNRLSQAAGTNAAPTVLQSALLGVALGFLWAPCAGPILGLILTGAAINGPSTQTTTLLFAYALGATVSLAAAVLIGGRVFAAMRRSLGAGEWIRRGLGVAVLLAVVAIALGWDTGVLARLSSARTTRLEQALLDRFPGHAAPANDPAPVVGESPGPPAPAPAMTMTKKASASSALDLPVEGRLPSLAGATRWFNSKPLTPEALRGKVVLIDFWTYSCINCLRALPYVKAWHARYKDHGLVVIGVHSPEFAFEKDADNVRRAIADLGVAYPVALDNDFRIWRAFGNRFWPAHYFIDADGAIRGHHFGEGEYDKSEALIRTLLAGAGQHDLPPALGGVEAQGVQSAADFDNALSPETYVGYERASDFSSPGGFARDEAKDYAPPAAWRRNAWALEGRWTVGPEMAVVDAAGGRISFRFHARDLHLVLGPSADGKPVRFRVTLDGEVPGPDHGMDVGEDGTGTVDGQRLYQLIRQSGDVRDRTFTIEFLDAGAQAFAFTFG
jgi:cytochrome c biogenesis protein CcdA/thiol-disulfide isomerase/thioredoxin